MNNEKPKYNHKRTPSQNKRIMDVYNANKNKLTAAFDGLKKAEKEGKDEKIHDAKKRLNDVMEPITRIREETFKENNGFYPP